MGLSRSSKRYQPTDKEADLALEKRLTELASRWKRFGYRRLHMMLQREGVHVNIKRTYRLYRSAGLMLKKKRKKKCLEKRGRPHPAPREINARWSMDFVSDKTANGNRLKILTLMDEATRECLALEVDTSLTGKRVCGVLNRVGWFRAFPRELLTDNGPEFTGNALNGWCFDRRVDHLFIDPGRPSQNGLIESFNGKLRDECLNQHWFKNLAEARRIVEAWRIEYNNSRPHTALGGLTPKEYAILLEAEDGSA